MEELRRPPELARMFDQAASAYEARPDYPGRIFEVLVERCGLGPGDEVLEIGPGTGQATLPMLDAGARVTAVEPGVSLAARLRDRTAGRAIDVVVADFEAADLADGSFDVVACATAFHWIDTRRGLARCARCLRPGGWIALWWTVWGDPDRADPLHEALVPLLRAKAPTLAMDDAQNRAHLDDVEARGGAIEHTAGFADYEHETVLWEGQHTPAGLRAIFATYSGWIALPEPLRTELLDDVAALVRDEFDGLVTRPYRTELFTARRS